MFAALHTDVILLKLLLLILGGRFCGELLCSPAVKIEFDIYAHAPLKFHTPKRRQMFGLAGAQIALQTPTVCMCEW